MHSYHESGLLLCLYSLGRIRPREQFFLNYIFIESKIILQYIYIDDEYRVPDIEKPQGVN